MVYTFDGKEPVVGSETYVSETATLIGDARVGDNCHVGHGAVLVGDHGAVEIGDGNAVEEEVVIHPRPLGWCRIGRRVTIGHGAIVHARSVGDLAVVGMETVWRESQPGWAMRRS